MSHDTTMSCSNTEARLKLHVFIPRCCSAHGRSRLSVSSWRRHRSAVTTRSARRMATLWLWTPGVRCWATVEGRSQAWCWWRSTRRSSVEPGGTCQSCSTAETLISITVWKRPDYKRSSVCVTERTV